MSLPFTRIEPAPLSDVAEQHLVRTRDGVRLATDVYLPDRPGRHPAVVCRLPYDKNSAWMAIEQIAPHYLDRGYVLVVQDVRGKFRSEGETYPFRNEVADTFDTLGWVTAQAWSDGTVGMVGDSYHGYTQWAGVAGGHPALRAIAPRVTGMAIGSWGGGAPQQRATSLYQANYFAHHWVDNAAYDYEVDWTVRPLRDLFESAFSAIGARSQILDRVLSGGPATPELAARPPFAARPVPVLHRVGWFDNLLDLSMQDYREQLAQPAWRHLAYLDADACDHYSFHLDDAPVPPERNHGLDPAVLQAMLPRYLGRTLDFFDVHVRGREGAVDRATWWHGHLGVRTAGSWPPVTASTLRLYPAEGAAATASADGGALDATPRAAEHAEWVHDPADPVPSTVVDSFTFLIEYPDESVVHDRPDVLTFTGAPLSEPLDLAGPVHAVVDLDVAGPSTDVFVKLHDVAPDGTTRLVVRGQRRVEGTAGGVVDLGETGYRFRPGHRLRLQVSASDFPLYAPHPGTADSPWDAVSIQPTRHRLRLGAGHTHLQLSVVTAL
ncbi:CocE/NonD family hydrolase [Nocardioides sp. BYT-33-1]|uniref:CocE/NonD family hydrolase n=1 Tax=Nocardioides sp. BYT-33-1 TaxID=3416952 RepID=UPI003F5309DC